MRDAARGARRRSDRAPVDRDRARRVRAARRSHAYDWVVFTSANGVEQFFDRGSHHAGSTPARSRRAVAAIGPGTAARSRPGHRADLVPERFVAESLLDAFPAATRDRRHACCSPRAEGARDVLPDGLTRSRVRASSPARVPDGHRRARPDDLERVRAGAFDAVTFTSSSTVNNFAGCVGAARRAAYRSWSRSGRSLPPRPTAQGSTSTSRPARTTSTALVAAHSDCAAPVACSHELPATAPAAPSPHPRAAAPGRREPALASTNSSRRCS